MTRAHPKGLKLDHSWRVAGRGADQHMAGLVDTVTLPDLTPVAAEAGAASEGDPRPVYTWEGPWVTRSCLVRSYLPSGGGAPRLVGGVGPDASLGVWDTGTGACLGGLQAPQGARDIECLVTYQRASDGRSRVAGVFNGGRLCIWDGDDFQRLHTMQTTADTRATHGPAVYDDPTSGSTWLVHRWVTIPGIRHGDETPLTDGYH
jgi:hypothetical protein